MHTRIHGTNNTAVNRKPMTVRIRIQILYRYNIIFYCMRKRNSFLFPRATKTKHTRYYCNNHIIIVCCAFFFYIYQVEDTNRIVTDLYNSTYCCRLSGGKCIIFCIARATDAIWSLMFFLTV